MATHQQAGPLSEKLLSEDTFPKLVADCKQLVASEVKKKNLALRTGFGVIEKAKPDLIDRAVRALLPEFVHTLEPFYQEAAAKPDVAFRDHLMANQEKVATAMLTVCDRRVSDVDNKVVKSGYQRLRGRAHKEVVAAMPGIATVTSKHL